MVSILAYRAHPYKRNGAFLPAFTNCSPFLISNGAPTWHPHQGAMPETVMEVQAGATRRLCGTSATAQLGSVQGSVVSGRPTMEGAGNDAGLREQRIR